jgi:hypothetical protein
LTFKGLRGHFIPSIYLNEQKEERQGILEFTPSTPSEKPHEHSEQLSVQMWWYLKVVNLTQPIMP